MHDIDALLDRVVEVCPLSATTQRVLALTETPLIASGGVRDADDIWALRDLGCEATVTGKALYEKTLKLAQVIRG